MTTLKHRGLVQVGILTTTLIVMAAMASCETSPPGTSTSTAKIPGTPSVTMPYQTLASRPDRLMVRLPNGLIVIAQEIPTAPVVSVHCWVKTGSVFEQEHNGKGLSHFLEHLVSGGTTSTRTEAENNKLLGQIGASTNAATSLDTVRYYINTDSAHTEIAIDLVSDWMQNSSIVEDQYKRERQVIQREFQMGAGEPDRIFWKATQRARYENHPARHPVIGYLDEFMAVSRDEIYDFYKRMYVPNNMVFVVAGNIDRKVVIDSIVAKWKDAKPGALPVITLPAEKPITAPRTAAVYADIDRPQIRLLWPGVHLRSKHDYALDLLGQILGQGELSRLVRVIRDEKRLVTSVDAFNYSTTWGRGFFGIDAVLNIPKPGPLLSAEQKLDQAQRQEAGARRALAQAPAPKQAELQKQIDAFAKDAVAARADVATLMKSHSQTIADKEKIATDAILAEVQKLLTDKPRQDELDRAKRKTIAASIYDGQTAHATAQRMASDFIATGDPDYLHYYAKTIQAVTAAQVLEAAQEYLRNDRLITVRLMPEKGASASLKRPADEPAIDLTGKTEKIELDNERLIKAFEKRSGGDQKLGAAEVGKVTMFRLDNGLRVVHQRSTRLPVISAQWYELGGLLGEDPGREGVANAVGQMMLKGAGGKTAEQIASELEGLGARMASASGSNTRYVSSQFLSSDRTAVLGLMANIILKPDFPDDQWQKLRDRLLAEIDSQNDQWYMHLRTSFRHSYFGDKHPWSQPVVGRRDVIEKLTVADLKKYHASRLGAADGALAIFGDISLDETQTLTAQLFGQMPKKAARPFVKPKPAKINKSRLEQVLSNKPMAAVQVGYGPGLTRDNPDYASLLVMNRVLDSFPVGWLDQALRGDGPGLVYAVGSGTSTGVVPGYWAFMFNTKPETVDQALGRALGVVERIRTEKIDAKTLDRARTKVLASEVMSRQSNSQRATSAALDELYGLGYNHGDQFIRRVRSVTIDDVQRVAKTYLRDPVGVILTNKKLDPKTLPTLK
jgi:predicted Zn-dependent peptidase